MVTFRSGTRDTTQTAQGAGLIKVLYDLNDGSQTRLTGYYRATTQTLFSDFAATSIVRLTAAPTDGSSASIRPFASELTFTEVGTLNYAGAFLESFPQPAVGANTGTVLASLVTDARSGQELAVAGQEVFISNGDQVGGVFRTVGVSAITTYTLTTDATANTFTTDTNHIIPANFPIQLLPDYATVNSALPAPLAEGVTYYVINPTSNTFQLALAAGGATIDITDTGTGPLRLSVMNLTLQRQDAALTLGQGVTVYADGATIPRGVVLSSRTAPSPPANAQSFRIEVRLPNSEIRDAVSTPTTSFGRDVAIRYNARAAGSYPGNSDLAAEANSAATFYGDSCSRIYRGREMGLLRVIAYNSYWQSRITYNIYYYTGEAAE